MRIVLTIGVLLAASAGLYLPLRGFWAAQFAATPASPAGPQKITLPAPARPLAPSDPPASAPLAPAATLVASEAPAQSINPPDPTNASNAIVRPPTSTPAQSSTGAVRWAGARDKAAAERRLAIAHAALRSDATNVDALRDAASALRELEQWDQAASMLRRLLEFEQTTAIRFELAMTLVRQRLWTEAIPLLREVVADDAASDALNPADDARRLSAAYNLALSLQAARRINEARHAWDDVIRLWPDNEDAPARRGEVLLDLHEWSAAAGDFAAASAAQPNDAGIALNLALAHYQAGDAAAARDALVAFLDRNPTNVPVMNRLAELHWTLYRADPTSRATDRNAAQDWCERSLAIDGQQPLMQALLRRVIAGLTSDSE